MQQHCQESLPHISEHAVTIFIRQQVEFKVAESPVRKKICFSSTSLSQTPSSKLTCVSLVLESFHLWYFLLLLPLPSLLIGIWEWQLYS